jgi:hypothetical protein
MNLTRSALSPKPRPSQVISVFGGPRPSLEKEDRGSWTGGMSMTQLTAAADLTHRRPVWEALAKLFLDTELQDDDHRRIATILSQSPYAPDEVEAILYGEVYPICILNLSSVAGEWADFDVDWLEQQILARDRRRLKWPTRLQVQRAMIRRDWTRVRALLIALTSGRGQRATEQPLEADGA